MARHLAEGYEGNSSIKAAVDNGEQVTSKDIFVAAAEGDKFANSIVDKVSEYLGLATANISNILNPDSVVIGGGVSAAGDSCVAVSKDTLHVMHSHKFAVQQK